MYSLRYFRIHNRQFINVIRPIICLSTQSQTLPQEVLKEAKTNQLFTRVVKKKPQRKPFMKNVFLGEFDSEFLGFPENLNKEELEKVDVKYSQVENCLLEHTATSSTQPILSSNLRNELRRLQVFGLQAPETMGGLEYSETENCYMLESIANNNALAISLKTHMYLGINAILKQGSDLLKQKYLNKLANGDSISAFCLLEEDNLDPSCIKTSAVRKEDGSFVLSGTKAWVVNGSQADIFIVLAQTEFQDSTTFQDKMSVLVVEKGFEGITVTPLAPSGLKEADICNVTFMNTPIPAENILGEGGDSVKIVSSLLSGLRLSTGPICITTMHKLIKHVTENALKTKQGHQGYAADSDFMREKISQINLDVYAMESMTYMTAGLLDRYEEHDCDLESAIVKVYCTERCLKTVQKCMLLSGPPAFMANNWLNKLFKDTLGHAMMSEANESLKMIIALLGLQHTGLKINDDVKKYRNPFFYPGFLIKKIWQRRKQEADDPKLDLHLEDYVHPSLTHAAKWLEYCVHRLQYASESILIRHGPHVIEQHMELRRLAEVAISIYGMTSVLSRASRSYCIGLHNADYEILLANAFCLNERDRVKRLVQELANGPYGTNDINYQKIAGRAFKYNGYFAEHVLTKNF